MEKNSPSHLLGNPTYGRAGTARLRKRRGGVLSLVVIVAVLLAALHSHVGEHRVPHPISAKVFVAKKVCVAKHVAQHPPQLHFNPVAVAVLGPQHLMTIGVVVPISTVVLPETAQFSFRLRGPPLVSPLYAG